VAASGGGERDEQPSQQAGGVRLDVRFDELDELASGPVHPRRAERCDPIAQWTTLPVRRASWSSRTVP
jgi:hypothetical protein